MTGELVHPDTGRPAAATTVFRDLVGHVEPALSDHGDLDLVEELLRALLARGNGALAQRAIFTRTQDLRAVVLDAVRDGSGRDPSTGSVLGAHRDPAEPASARKS